MQNKSMFPFGSDFPLKILNKKTHIFWIILCRGSGPLWPIKISKVVKGQGQIENFKHLYILTSNFFNKGELRE